MNKKRLPRWKLILQGLPLVAVAGMAFLPLQRLGQQVSVLVVLVWVQVFFIAEVYLINK